MATIDHAREILELSKLKLPAKPNIVRLEVEDYVDNMDEDALRVLLILDEGTRDEELTGDAVWAIKMAIRDALLAAEITRFPFISFAKQSELDQLREDDEE
jgi:hypothetical protein